MYMTSTPKPGDRVKVHTKEETIEGIFLPRSEMLDKRSGKETLVLKLDNGYNIGIFKERIEGMDVVERHKPSEKKSFAKKKGKNLPKVLIISCGGTISSKVDYLTGGVYSDYDAGDFVEMMPSIEKMADIDTKTLMNKMSEDFLPEDWKTMAREVYNNYDDYDGFVITQGTDTLHYSSASLSFFLRNIGKPVVFTAAQRSIDRGSSDAFMNLECAVRTAAYADLSGVFVCMHATVNDDFCYIHKGTKVRKMHSLRRDAFRTINGTPVASVHYSGEDAGKIEMMSSAERRKREKHPVKISDGFEEKIAIINVYPGMDPGIIDYHLGKGCKGFVISGTALGHVSLEGKKSLKKQLLSLKKEGIPVVMTTQSIYGRVDPLVYSPLRFLSIEANVIFAEDMLTEVAYVKLGWLLSKKKKYEEIREDFMENFAGEFNLISRENEFLN